MDKLTYIKISTCPFSRQADIFLRELKEEFPEYQTVSINMIVEDLDPEAASKYSYELVPNFWIGDEKVFEGVPTKEAIQKVLDQAMGKSAGDSGK